ncbi:MAG: hypothetical protein WC307_01900 [Candidatus Nanoarchaeia archaeon]
MNKYFLAFLFLFSTTFFVVQHSTGLSWDFSVYSLNAHYLLTGSGYFEWARPPLASLLMIPGDYFYIIFVSLIGLFATIKFSERYSLKPEVFYSFLLSPFVLLLGFSVGTEFLSLSLALLLFAYLPESSSGLFAALGVLAHNSNLFNVFFLLFQKDWRKLLTAFLLFALVFVPWFIFNYSLKGDPLYSMIDQYVLNVKMRDYYVSPPNLVDFAIVLSFVAPFLFYGLFKSFRKPLDADWLMLLFLFTRVIVYLMVPFKTSRYLFLIVLPAAYFASRGLSRFNYKTCFIILALTFLVLPFYTPYFSLEASTHYVDAAIIVNSSCMAASNAWPFINKLGVDCAPSPRQQLVSLWLDRGYTLVMFKNVMEPDYIFNESFMASLPVIYENNYFYVISNESACLAPYNYDVSYVEELNNTLFDLYNQTFSFTLWDLI